MKGGKRPNFTRTLFQLLTMAEPQLPPTRALEPDRSWRAQAEASWHHYPVMVYPQHTDRAGVVWHGSYLTWMEAARIEFLREEGIDYDNLVALGCDLPVVELSLRYHRALRSGQQAILKTRFAGFAGARILLDQHFCPRLDEDSDSDYLSAKVTLVVLDSTKGRVMRRLPPDLHAALAKKVVG
ncbi:MAG: thioesterase family protein [Cyanobacteria bacterium J06641_5]